MKFLSIFSRPEEALWYRAMRWALWILCVCAAVLGFLGRSSEDRHVASLIVFLCGAVGVIITTLYLLVPVRTKESK